MKHKIIALLLIPTLMLIFSACNKRLDVIPTQTLTPEAGLKTESDSILSRKAFSCIV